MSKYVLQLMLNELSNTNCIGVMESSEALQYEYDIDLFLKPNMVESKVQQGIRTKTIFVKFSTQRNSYS